jgi:hypothetical protein
MLLQFFFFDIFPIFVLMKNMGKCHPTSILITLITLGRYYITTNHPYYASIMLFKSTVVTPLVDCQENKP